VLPTTPQDVRLIRFTERDREKHRFPSIRLVANGEDIVKPQDFTLHRYSGNSLNGQIVGDVTIHNLRHQDVTLNCKMRYILKSDLP